LSEPNRCCQIPHRAKVGLNHAALALHSGPLDLEVGRGLRLDHKLVGEVVALGRWSSAARSLEIGDVLKVMAELNDDGGGVERCASLPACRAPERQLL
jgi:hypothetical protein